MHSCQKIIKCLWYDCFLSLSYAPKRGAQGCTSMTCLYTHIIKQIYLLATMQSRHEHQCDHSIREQVETHWISISFCQARMFLQHQPSPLFHWRCRVPELALCFIGSAEYRSWPALIGLSYGSNSRNKGRKSHHYKGFYSIEMKKENFFHTMKWCSQRSMVSNDHNEKGACEVLNLERHAQSSFFFPFEFTFVFFFFFFPSFI